MAIPSYIVHKSDALNQWVKQLEEKFGEDEIRYREVGGHGWTSLCDDENGNLALKPHKSGWHYIDASPRRSDHPMKGYLFGTFDCTTDTGKLYA